MDITQSKYFFYGSPHHNSKQYGLYDPVLNRFVIVSKDANVLEMLQIILRVKYRLLLCDISSASNWTTSLIDNSCCFNWAVNDGSIQFFLMNSGVDIITIPELTQADAIEADQLILTDQEYFLFAGTVIKEVLDLMAHDWAWHNRNAECQIKRLTGMELPLPETPVNPLLKTVSEALYHGDNIQAVIDEIKLYDGKIILECLQ